MAVEQYDNNFGLRDYIGKSTDVKPTGVASGCTFLELDTLDIYIYSISEGWVRL